MNVFQGLQGGVNVDQLPGGSFGGDENIQKSDSTDTCTTL